LKSQYLDKSIYQILELVFQNNLILVVKKNTHNYDMREWMLPFHLSFLNGKNKIYFCTLLFWVLDNWNNNNDSLYFILIIRLVVCDMSSLIPKNNVINKLI